MEGAKVDMPGGKRAEDVVKPASDAESEDFQVQGTKMKLEDRTDPDTKFFCVVNTAPAEKQW